MLVNYLRIAWRTLWRHRTTTAVNLVGLSVGLAVCFLVVLLLHQQWQIDRFHPNSDRIYSVSSRHVVAEDQWSATAPGPLGPALRAQAPGVRAVTQLAKEDETFVMRGDRSVMVDIMYADSSFFDVFQGFRLCVGTRATALTTPGTAVLTTETARRLFGDADPVGQTLSLRGEEPVTVTGVLTPPPGPTHLAGDLFLSHEPPTRTIPRPRRGRRLIATGGRTSGSGTELVPRRFSTWRPTFSRAMRRRETDRRSKFGFGP